MGCVNHIKERTYLMFLGSTILGLSDNFFLFVILPLAFIDVLCVRYPNLFNHDKESDGQEPENRQN